MERATERRQTPAPPPRVRVILHPRDPPGQRSFYVSPNDSRREAYRLYTFCRFPNNNVDSRSLARSGFYFTGYKDRIRCFSCGVAVENLSGVDDARSSYWHSHRCEFAANRGLAGNVPIGQKRSALPNSQITSEKAMNFAMPQFTTIRQDPASHTPEITNQFAVYANPATGTISGIFPSRNLINPHMRSVEIRPQTFVDRATYWPSHRINATPRDIANARFYHLGQRVPVRCWYCNGGLQNWDDARTERVKLFQICELILQLILSKFSDLRRPISYNPFGNENNAAPPERQPFYQTEAASSCRAAATSSSIPTATAASSRPAETPFYRPTPALSPRPQSASFCRSAAASSLRPAAASSRRRLHESQRHRLYMLFCELCNTDRHDLCSFPELIQENMPSSGQHAAPTSDVIGNSQESL